MSELIIAPFSNSDIRDWPVGHYSALAGLLVERLPDTVLIRIVGTAGQRSRGHDVVRAHRADRVVNDCGLVAWAALLRHLRGAACVVGNNSGISHLSGHYGTPTVCIFGGSHQRGEWRPQGDHVVLLSRAIGCSPCQLDHNARSPYNKACLREISPETAADAVMLAMNRAGRNPAPPSGGEAGQADRPAAGGQAG